MNLRKSQVMSGAHLNAKGVAQPFRQSSEIAECSVFNDVPRRRERLLDLRRAIKNEKGKLAMTTRLQSR